MHAGMVLEHVKEGSPFLALGLPLTECYYNEQG